MPIWKDANLGLINQIPTVIFFELSVMPERYLFNVGALFIKLIAKFIRIIRGQKF